MLKFLRKNKQWFFRIILIILALYMPIIAFVVTVIFFKTNTPFWMTILAGVCSLCAIPFIITMTIFMIADPDHWARQ